MIASTCRYCGASIFWGTLPDGKRVPLSRRAPVYVVRGASDNVTMPVTGAMPDEALMIDRANDPRQDPPLAGSAWVSHFTDCPGATKASTDAAKARTEAAARRAMRPDLLAAGARCPRCDELVRSSGFCGCT